MIRSPGERRQPLRVVDLERADAGDLGRLGAAVAVAGGAAQQRLDAGDQLAAGERLSLTEPSPVSISTGTSLSSRMRSSTDVEHDERAQRGGAVGRLGDGVSGTLEQRRDGQPDLG